MAPTASYLLVIGSSNTDMVINAHHLPAPGETIIGKSFFMNPGGKGANQAVAAARLGSKVTFICKTGNDIFGKQSIELFKQEGIDTSYLLSDPNQPSGVALITVDDNAENCIVVASGANATLSVSDIEASSDIIKNASLLLMQLEIPVETVLHAAETAFRSGVKVILNPAPVCDLPKGLYKYISIITPNETEAGMLAGMKVTDRTSAETAAKIIHDKGAETVILTLGAEGALVYNNNEFTHVPGIRVKAVDTTAAGDVFSAAFAVALSEGQTIIDATAFACKAASVSVTRKGAQSSAPYRHELNSSK